MEQKNGQNRKRRGDILLLVSCLGLAVLALGAKYLFRTPGATAVVRQEGQVLGRYPLRNDISIPIDSEPGYNLLVIEDGQAYIREADCPHSLCVREGRIRHVGETLTCLPHKLTVTIEGADNTAPDAYTH